MHPERWKFDYPVYHPRDRAAWRAWLNANHDSERGVWVASWKKDAPGPAVAYEALVEEALCFGWIDSTVNTLDDARRLQMMTPRRPRSPWTRLNRQRITDMDGQGLLTDAGRSAVDAAKANGYWTIFDPVEDLLEPPELSDALDLSSAARAAWDSFPPSARKQMLWWVISARTDATRTKRVAKVVHEAAQGRRAVG